MEVAVTSESSGQQFNVCVWDPLTGTTLRTFKGGISCSKTLNIVGGDYVLSSQKDKQILQMWALNRQDQLTSKIVMPGVVQVLRVSPCSTYCVGAVAEQLHVWLLSTGRMVASLRRHYQNISEVRFTADSSHFVSAGSEGLVLAWSMESVLDSATMAAGGGSGCEPEKTWSDHSLPVTCLHVTASMIQPLVFSVSLDQTLRIRQLDTGVTLLSLSFDKPLYSVVVDHAEETCYVGTETGKIHAIGLLDPPRRTEQAGFEDMNDQLSSSHKFIGHEKAVTCLSVSIDGSQLLSGSDDGNARLWDISSGQCVRLLCHRGPLTNVFFAPRHRHLETDKFTPRVVLGHLEKGMKKAGDSQDAGATQFQAVVNVECRPLASHSDGTSTGGRDETAVRLLAEQQLVRSELSGCKRVNRQLYAFALDKILGGGGSSNNKTRKKIAPAAAVGRKRLNGRKS